jgi:hypothetical protein
MEALAPYCLRECRVCSAEIVAIIPTTFKIRFYVSSGVEMDNEKITATVLFPRKFFFEFHLRSPGELVFQVVLLFGSDPKLIDIDLIHNRGMKG